MVIIECIHLKLFIASLYLVCIKLSTIKLCMQKFQLSAIYSILRKVKFVPKSISYQSKTIQAFYLAFCSIGGKALFK